MSVTVSTAAGEVRGKEVADGVTAFLGIPYAAPPVGELRFRKPHPPAPHAEPLDAFEYGPTAPQSRSTGPLTGILPNVIIPGDDYLNLNVWTPDVEGSAPVMVFIHGGSWTSGSGAVAGYDGAAFARDGVVLVTINYRLGADGFAWFGDGPANLGMLDQIAALEWVRDTIAAFGGDPAAVTVFGESAGAMSVGALLVMPAAEGLFGRAIMESGGVVHAIDRDSAVLVANRLADILGVPRTREGLASVSTDALLAAQTRLSGEVSKKPRKKLWGDVARNGLPFEPVVDGTSLPGLPLDVIREGAAAHIEILVGNNTEEGMLVVAPMGVNKIKRWFLSAAAIRVGLPPLRAPRTYQAARPGARPGDLLSDMLTDWLYRIPAMRLGEAHAKTHVYEFSWRSPAFDGELGACHGVELPFVFDTLDDPSWHGLTQGKAPQSLASRVHDTWVAFAKTGDPGWSRYSMNDRVVMHLASEPALLTDPLPRVRELWAGRR